MKKNLSQCYIQRKTEFLRIPPIFFIMTDMFTLHTVPFDAMKGFSSLVQNFVANQEFRSARFPNNDRLYERSYIEAAGQRVSNDQRQQIVSVIRSSMYGLTLSVAQEQSLKQLLDVSSVTIITGQQPVVAGGAMYCAYKAMSAIDTARRLAEEHPDIAIVPVYWVEDNDHDIEEVSTAYTLDGDGQPHAITIPTAHTVRHGIGDRVFGEELSAVLADIRTWHGHSVPAIQALVEQAYHKGGGFSEGFIRILQELFADDGLVFVSSKQLRYAGLMQAVIAEDARVPHVTNTALERGSAELVQRGFHAQVQGAEVNFFIHDAIAGRVKVKQRTDKLFACGESAMTHQALCHDIAERPQAYSSTVVIRPVIQDSVFPNLAYIAGPGELAYFAQFKEVYERFGMQMPAILLRHTATILPAKLWSAIEPIGGFSSVLCSSHELEFRLNQLMEEEEEIQFLRMQESTIMATFDKLHTHIEQIDSTLTATAGATQTRVSQHIKHLIHKAIKAEKRKQTVVVQRIRQASAWIYPTSSLQERSLSVLWALHTFGVKGTKQILTQLVAKTNTAHHVLLV